MEITKQKEIIKLLLGRPIAVNPALIKITGSFSGAILLAQAIYWENTMGGEFWKTNEDWQKELYISKKKFKTARKKTSKFLKVVKKGLPAKNYYTIDWEALEKALTGETENCTDLYPTKVGSLDTHESGVTYNTKTTHIQETLKKVSSPSSEPILKALKIRPPHREEKIKEIYKVFEDFGFEVALWGKRKQNREAAEILFNSKGKEKVKEMLRFFQKEYKGTTTIGNTYDLSQKYDIIKKEYLK